MCCAATRQSNVTGEVGNLGAHNVDESRWAIGQQSIAPKAISIGGRFGMDDDGETANTQITFFDYKPVPIIYEVRGLRRRKGLRARDHYRGTNFGMVVNCEGGYFRGGRGGKFNTPTLIDLKKNGYNQDVQIVNTAVLAC